VTVVHGDASVIDLAVSSENPVTAKDNLAIWTLTPVKMSGNASIDSVSQMWGSVTICLLSRPGARRLGGGDGVAKNQGLRRRRPHLAAHADYWHIDTDHRANLGTPRTSGDDHSVCSKHLLGCAHLPTATDDRSESCDGAIGLYGGSASDGFGHEGSTCSDGFSPGAKWVKNRSE